MQSWIRKNPTFCCVLVVAIIFWFFFSRFYTTFSMDTSSVKEGMVHGPNPNPKPEINAPGVAYTPFPDAEPYQARDAYIGAAKATSDPDSPRISSAAGCSSTPPPSAWWAGAPWAEQYYFSRFCAIHSRVAVESQGLFNSFTALLGVDPTTCGLVLGHQSTWFASFWCTHTSPSRVA